MKQSNPCQDCKWARHLQGPTVIKSPIGDIQIFQCSPTSIHCECKTIKSMTITDGEMVCSSFEPKSNEKE